MYHRSFSTTKTTPPRVTIDTTKLAHVERRDGRWVVIANGQLVASVTSTEEAMKVMRQWNATQQEETK